MGDTVQLPTQAPAWRDVEFDTWLRDQETLEVYGRLIDAADALATDKIAYLDGLEQWRSETRPKLDHTVIDELPQPIAAFYRPFLKGNRDPVRRFLNARHTWEALIHFLHATVLAEIRAADVCLNECGINPAWVDSQTLRERIELVRLSLKRSQYALPVSGHITPTLLGSTEQLVGSHRTAPTEQDALRLLDEEEPLLISALREAAWLAEMELLRPQGLKHKQVLRGSRGEPDHCLAGWNPAQRATIAASEDSDRELFLLAEEHLLPLAPLLRAHDAPDSRGVQVAYLKQRKGTTLVYGMFGPGPDQSYSDPIRIEQLQHLRQRYAANRRKQG